MTKMDTIWGFCHAKTGPAYNWSARTTYGCHNWSPGPLMAGCHNWSPGPLMAATTGPPDHLWLPQLVPQTTYCCHNWSPGPLMTTTTGPPDHLWLPQLVPQTTYGCHNCPPDHLWLPQLVPGGSRLGLEARAILISTYTGCTDTRTTSGSRPPVV